MKKKQPRIVPGMYLFYSEDKRKLCLLADSEVPLDVRQFLFSVQGWVEMARRNPEMLQTALEEDEDEHDDDKGSH